MRRSEPDAFQRLIGRLEITQAVSKRFLEFGEYASIELTVDKDMTITAARFLPMRG